MNTIILFEEYRFIERNGSVISSAWKGAHLLLFFLAFIFGSSCTFCFHMLIYFFDDKCVLFPKLLSLTPMQRNVQYECIPSDKEVSEALPVDFISAQWVDKSICYLPTFVPLVSGICGLVWTTMFLMCSTGSQTLTGLKRPWRVLPHVFIFSVAIGGLCIYATCVTHLGLQALCLKLGEITNTTSCSYTLNETTLVYERRIRDVYHATILTIVTAWLHTCCWILSVVLTLVRVLLAVDFQLVKVNAELQGDIEKMLERHERHIRTVSPEVWMGDRDKGNESCKDYARRTDITNIIYKNKRFKTTTASGLSSLERNSSDILYVSNLHQDTSELALVPSELSKLAILTAYETIPTDKHFILRLLYDLVESLEIVDNSSDSEVFSLDEINRDQLDHFRKVEGEIIDIKTGNVHDEQEPRSVEQAAQSAKDNLSVEMSMTSHGATANSMQYLDNVYDLSPSISAEIRDILEYNLTIGLTKSDIKRIMELKKKSNLKSVGIQTDKSKGERRKRRINITESRSSHSVGTQHDTEKKDEEPDKETQTPPKEKQD